MRLAIIGLGKMGYNMTLRLIGGGHEVVAFDSNVEVARGLSAKSIELRSAALQARPPPT